MYRKIDKVEKFGVFKNFSWDDSVIAKGTEPDEFKKLNVIYGRNYSGKTTLSRMFRAIELGNWPEKYDEASFAIIDDGGIHHQYSKQAVIQNENVRVYNKDFVSDNLGFLTSEDSDIQSFAVLGATNTKIAIQERDLQSQLGSEEDQSGLRWERKLNTDKLLSVSQKYSSSERFLDKKLVNFANNTIKTHPTIGDYKYNVTKLRDDISEVRKLDRIELVDDITEQTLTELINESIKTIKYSNPPNLEELENFIESSNKALTSSLKPNQPILELLHDSALSKWVEDGVKHHKHKRKKCGFCGSNLPDDLWAKLDAHFDQESRDQKEAIELLIKQSDNLHLKISNIINYSIEDTYVAYRKEIEESRTEIERAIEDVNHYIDVAVAALKAKKDDIFNVHDELPSFSTSLTSIIDTLRTIEDEHNSYSKQLSDDQSQAKLQIKQDLIFRFITEKEIVETENKKLLAGEQKEIATTELSATSKKIDEVLVSLEKLVSERVDERGGAKIVSDYLKGFFGHEALELKAIKSDNGYKFQIYRGDNPAYNLSEGECSLIAFCYFMAKLKDINSANKDLIIWIDDPISSLDSNHVFFVYSLIEAELARPISKFNYLYRQLYISTHNLEFLKFLKRLSFPLVKIDDPGKSRVKKDNNFFLIEREGKSSAIKKMPRYLSEYITEFNYLFHQIYKCASQPQTDKNHDSFYNFGNNLRKFLEAYLFFKYPSIDMSADERVRQFFAPDTAAAAFTGRISNELSHLEEIFDRSMVPIEYPEIGKLARYVLERINTSDPEQYKALLISVGIKPDEDILKNALEEA
ncbi:AAA family ATPase [Pseudovibrio sp. Alg231-02]|uniref:AAA family ATPase n=1 Tax=Pseudovibrio sp. Alg231-02 TaxID=1922223 RepID=UPI000D557CC5|nr:AAA family ATPase [Pseudovibrio sp. Alg231-02]